MPIIGQMDSDALAPIIELGDTIYIISTKDPVYGDVIYRDKDRIRIKYHDSRTTGREYLLDTDGDFKEEEEVFKVQVRHSSDEYHYSAMIGVQPGETVEFYKLDGTPVEIDPETKATGGVVSQLLKTDTEDALILTSGFRLDFNGYGPSPDQDIAIIVPAIDSSVVGGDMANDEELRLQQQEERQEIFQFQSISQLLKEIMPTSVIEEIPSAERFYPDAIQRQEMYNDLVMDLTPDKQKNTRALIGVSQMTEYLLALKQSTVKLNVANRPIGQQKSTFDTLLEITDEVQNSYIPACVPIYDVKKTLYMDKKQTSSHDSLIFQSLLHVEHDGDKRLKLYETGEMAAAGGGALTFFSYLDSMFQFDLHPYSPADTLVGAQREAVAYEQEGYVAPAPGVMRPGFTENLPEGYQNTLAHKLGRAFDPLTKEFVNSVSVRTARFLPSVKAIPNKGIPVGTLSQPADQVITTGYVILDTPSILHSRTLVNAPSLLTRILIADYQSERKVQHLSDLNPTDVTDANAQNHAIMLTKAQVQQMTPEFWDIWVKNNLARTLSPIHGLNPASPLLCVALDAFVPNRSDYPKSLQEEVWRFIDKNMALWIQANGASRQRITKKLNENGGVEGETYPTMIENPNTLNKRVLEDVLLNILVRRINEKETILRNNSQVLMGEFEKGFDTEAYIQYATIITQLEGREPAFDPAFHKAKLEQLLKSQQDRKNIAAELAKATGSKPEVNSCSHVRFLIGVRRALLNGHNHTHYIELFKVFLAKYQGPRNGNWIMCEECNKELVCVHEIMTLNEALHPGRALSLHRKLLLDFGGPVFEGNYTCKNCGVPIQEIEYDNHLEFDDEGRPISGRAVLQEDTKQLDLTEIVSRKEVIQYATEDENKLFQIIKIISERAGSTDVNKDMVDRMIYYAQAYLGIKVPPKAIYDQQIAIAVRSGARGKIPTYEEYTQSHRVYVIASLFLIELQTAKPPIQIKYPFSQCQFSIQGFPTEGMKPEEAGTGALDYVACCVASIDRRDEPWGSTTWSLYPDIKKRIDLIKKSMISVTNLLLGTTISGTQLFISDQLRRTLRKRIDSLKLEKREQLASSKDKLPAGFMPEPVIQFPANVVNEPTSADPNQTVAVMNIAGADGPRKSLIYRLSVLYAQLKQDSYKAAEKSNMLVYGSGRSDSYSSPMGLKDIKRGGLQVLGLIPLEEEAHRLASALRTLELRTPTSTPAGTHIWTPWSPRVEPLLKVEIPKNILYKLFLRNCYAGPSIGSPHKIGFGNTCKNCGFEFPVSPDIIDPEKEGKPALDAQGVDYSEAEFEKILAARRDLRTQNPYTKPEDPELLKNLQRWIAAPVMGPDDAAMWTQVASVMRALFDSKTADRPPARAQAWGDFVTRYDAEREDLRAKVAGSATRKARGQAVAASFLSHLDILTQNPFSAGIDAIANAIISPMLQKAQAYMISTVTSLREVKERGKADVIFARGIKQWMKISGEHTQLLNQIMTRHTELISGGSVEMREVCKRAGMEFGRWMRMWKTQIFEEPLLGFTETEAQYVLRYVIVHLFRQIINTQSWYYKDLPKEEGKPKPDVETTAKEVIAFLAESMEKTAFNLRLPTQKELEEILLKRAEIERNYIIDVFDKLDDDEKPLEKLQKKLGLGKWAMGRNVRDYSVELFEHDRSQRIQMGLRDLPAVAEGHKTREDFGFASIGGGESRADRAYGHEDIDAQERAE